MISVSARRKHRNGIRFLYTGKGILAVRKFSAGNFGHEFNFGALVLFLLKFWFGFVGLVW